MIWPADAGRDLPRWALAAASKPDTSRLLAVYLKSLAMRPSIFLVYMAGNRSYTPCLGCTWDWTQKRKERTRRLARRGGRPGLPEKPTQCAECGRYAPDELEAHHPDLLGEPLKVVWLCKYCHGGGWWRPARRRRTRKRHIRWRAGRPPERKKITPAAIRLAAEARIDYLTVKGTGANGRILKRDVRRAVEARKRRQFQDGKVGRLSSGRPPRRIRSLA